MDCGKSAWLSIYHEENTNPQPPQQTKNTQTKLKCCPEVEGQICTNHYEEGQKVLSSMHLEMLSLAGYHRYSYEYILFSAKSRPNTDRTPLNQHKLTVEQLFPLIEVLQFQRSFSFH